MLAAVFGALHFLFREKPKIDWNFEKTGYPVTLSWSQAADGTRTYVVDGINLNGENISGHTLHQIDGDIRLTQDNRVLPLFAVINGIWDSLSELDGVPSRAILSLGFQFRPDGVHPADIFKPIGLLSVS